MRLTRALFRAADAKAMMEQTQAIPAPAVMRPASEAPSPLPHIIIGSIVGLGTALVYKMYYWNWRKELNQFYYDYDKTMAEARASEIESTGKSQLLEAPENEE